MSDEKTAPPPYQQPPPQQQGYPPPQQGYLPPQQGYPPPQQGYAPPPTTTATTGVTVVQRVQPGVSWSEHPVSNYKCQFCGNIITTIPRNKMGNATLLITLILFLFIGLFALIFLCIPFFHDVEHVCPVDGNVVGVYKRMNF